MPINGHFYCAPISFDQKIISSTICHENSSKLAIFGTFGPFWSIFGPFWPISDLLMTGIWDILEKLSVF